MKQFTKTGRPIGDAELVGTSALRAADVLDMDGLNLRIPGLNGDITGGAGMGAGAAARLKAAKPCGVGVDPEYVRAEHEADLCQRSHWVAELLTSEHSLGKALMLLAGGREFGTGTGVRLNGNGMAPRAARYMKAKRERMPSDTSLDDAAAAAACALAFAVKEWEYVLDIAGELPVERVRNDSCVRGSLAARAWRAAFASLNDDGAAENGATVGRMAGEQRHGLPLALDAGQCATAAESLRAHFDGVNGARFESTETETKRALASWLWSSLVPTLGRGANAARARASAIKRARFLIRVVHGATWPDAARLAGYADSATASKAVADGKTWATLEAAQKNDAGNHPIARTLFRRWLAAARLEVKARRNARPLLRTSAPRGNVRPCGVRQLVIQLADGGGVMVRGVRGCIAPRITRKVRSLAVNIGTAAAAAIDAREQAAQRTSAAASRLQAFMARASKSFESGIRGLRRGALQ